MSDETWPDVDVVMPIRDEAEHLEAAISSIRAQSYRGKLRIFLGLAPSTDSTEGVAARLADEGDDVVVVTNPAGTTPAGLNVAIRAGSAPVVLRVDGHSELSDGYVTRAVETLRRTGAANVGGMQVPHPATPFEEAVAAATTSWLGTGGASYRVGGTEGPVDTVYLGVFDRAAIEGVGLFDERLIRNQDYELNIRLRQAGGTVWFDPDLSVGYRPRGSWKALAKQYYEYGYWKAQVIRLHPHSMRPRQLLAPVAVLAIAASFLVSPRRPVALLGPIAYGVAVATSSRSTSTAGRSVVRSFGVAPTIHVAWTAGLIAGLRSVGGTRRISDTRNRVTTP